MIAFLFSLYFNSIKSKKEIYLVLVEFKNHGTISKTVPWLKSVTFIEP